MGVQFGPGRPIAPLFVSTVAAFREPEMMNVTTVNSLRQRETPMSTIHSEGTANLSPRPRRQGAQTEGSLLQQQRLLEGGPDGGW
jgi:hypothetical protein